MTILANGYNVASQRIGKVSFSPSLNLKFVLNVLACSFNHISLSQLSH